MSLVTLVCDLSAAKTQQEENAAYAKFDAWKAREPSVSEQVTQVLRRCTTIDETPILQSQQYADLVDGRLVLNKPN